MGLVLLAGLSLPPLPPAIADQAVLADGRVLRVNAVRPLGPNAWLLELAGGGEISCARSRLVEVRPDPPPIGEPGPIPPTWAELAGPYGDIIGRLAEERGLEPRLVVAVIKAESNFDPQARSPKGAQGLMQLMPGTARDLAVGDPFDPEENIRGGIDYLSQMLDRFEGDLELALAAYNAGPEAVVRHGGVPPYAETQAYIRRVLSQYRRL
jgi:soluble lytic murein transglycosylase-like protein